MSTTENTGPGEMKPQDPKGQVPEKIVIPDECGDSLWDDVLAQYPDLTIIINKTKDKESDQQSSASQSTHNKS